MATTDTAAVISTDDPQIPLDAARAIGITRRNTTPGVDVMVPAPPFTMLTDPETVEVGALLRSRSTVVDILAFTSALLPV